MGSKRRRSTAPRIEEAPPVEQDPAAEPTQEAEQGPPLEAMIGTLVASLFILWRAQAYPINQLWRDWVAIVSAYGIFTALAGKSRAWPVVTVVVMGYMLVIFASGNLPKALGMLGWKS